MLFISWDTFIISLAFSKVCRAVTLLLIFNTLSLIIDQTLIWSIKWTSWGS